MTHRSVLPDLNQLEVWFATGSQELYGPETLAQVAQQSQAVVDELNAASDIPVKIVAYLRSPNSHLHAWYNQLVKLGANFGNFAVTDQDVSRIPRIWPDVGHKKIGHFTAP